MLSKMAEARVCARDITHEYSDNADIVDGQIGREGYTLRYASRALHGPRWMWMLMLMLQSSSYRHGRLTLVCASGSPSLCDFSRPIL